jgi:hypothetical protein
MARHYQSFSAVAEHGSALPIIQRSCRAWLGTTDHSAQLPGMARHDRSFSQLPSMARHYRSFSAVAGHGSARLIGYLRNPVEPSHARLLSAPAS